MTIPLTIRNAGPADSFGAFPYHASIWQPKLTSNSLVAPCLGIEITHPQAMRLCDLGNIDGQHGPTVGFQARAAIDMALEWPLPPPGSTLITCRADLDSLGAMAVLSLRAQDHSLQLGLLDRVARVAWADRFARGPWPGPRPLPRFLQDLQDDPDRTAVSVMAHVAGSAWFSLDERITAVRNWLLTGWLHDDACHAYSAENRRLLHSLRMGATRVLRRRTPSGRIYAVVTSTERGAIRLGYLEAPVVLAMHPVWEFPDGAIGRKHTLACWAPDEADFGPILEVIGQIEEGWGGHAAIKGSPQFRPSAIEQGQLIEIIDRLL